MTSEDQEHSIFGTTTLDPNGNADPKGEYMQPEKQNDEGFGKVVKHVERGTHAHLKRASELLQKNINVNRKP